MTPERVYAALLTLYPRAFRDAYASNMLEAFRDLRLANRQPPFAFWRFALGDLARSACWEQIDACRTGARRVVLGWLAVCALGIIGTGLMASLVTRGFEYLYHPYLEGLQFSPWSYGALLGAGLGVAQSLALRHRMRASIAWILVSAASASLGLHLAATIAALGPACCGLAIGAVVGGCQWALMRTRGRRPGWAAAASAASAALGIVLFDGLIQHALGGMNPVVADFRARAFAGSQYGDAIGLFVRGLQQPRDWADVVFEFAAMAVSGLTIGAMTARQLPERQRAGQTAR